jgi:pimeloyl-ACP methyl ester carboxylesterase
MQSKRSSNSSLPLSSNNSLPSNSLHWTHRIGHRRDWRWRGWRVHYTYTQRQAAIGSPALPILMLHGFGASIGHWRNNIPALSQHHPVYALDLLGFGASEKASAHYTTGLWVEQVYDFWRTFIQVPVVLVGHSLGSTVGLALAVAHPEMLAGLVMFTLPDASVLGGPSWLRSPLLKRLFSPLLNFPLAILRRVLTFPPLFVPLFRLVRRPKTIRQWAKGAYSQSHLVDDELVDVFSSPAYDRGAVRALSAMVNAKGMDRLDYSARSVLPKLTLPMLLIWGQQDRAVPPQLAPKFLNYNPGIKLIELQDVGHCAHDECSEDMNQTMLAWIAQNVQLPDIDLS